VKPFDVRTACYKGVYGSTAPGQVKIDHGEVEFSAQNLRPSEGLTIVVGLPEGSVVLPTVFDEIAWFIMDWKELFLLPAITALILYSYWRAVCYQPGADKPISVEWNPPPNLAPCEVGTLIDESCDMPDLTSTAIDLAARGYIKIRETLYNGFLAMGNIDYEFT